MRARRGAVASCVRDDPPDDRRVTDDLEKFRFNRAVARIRELTNALGDCRREGADAPGGAAEALETLVQLIGPMMPHLAEELWQRLGHDGAAGRRAVAGGRSGAARRRARHDRGAGQRQAARHPRAGPRRSAEADGRAAALALPEGRRGAGRQGAAQRHRRAATGSSTSSSEGGSEKLQPPAPRDPPSAGYRAGTGAAPMGAALLTWPSSWTWAAAASGRCTANDPGPATPVSRRPRAIEVAPIPDRRGQLLRNELTCCSIPPAAADVPQRYTWRFR